MELRTSESEGSAARSPETFVGRRPELSELSSALSSARTGRGALYLIAGESGIGKTRLAEAVALEAAEQGDTLLWGSAWEAGGAPAYWPWTQVIRGLVQERPLEQVREDLGAAAPLVAQIAPELSDRLGPVGPGASLDTDPGRFTAFDAVASFLCASAERRPLLIVLDNLHAADVATLRLLEFVARGLRGTRILVLATYRTGAVGRHAEVMAALADVREAAERLQLGGLARDEVAELAAARAVTAPPADFVERLHALTEGNPLFVDELMRVWAAEGSLAAHGRTAAGRLALPRGVRDTIRRRLDPLSPATVRVLAAAAVIGPQFRLETLAQVAAVERPALLEQLDLAAEAGLVAEVAGGLGSYRFSHALVRETLYDDLSARDRVGLHAAVGQALLDLYGEGPDAPYGELAHHFLEAAPAGDAARAAEFAVGAGELALNALGYEQAIEFFADALRALDLKPLDPDRRGAILLTMGQAEMRAGRLEDGRRTLGKATELARRTDDSERLARAALASAPWGLATGLSDEEDLVPLLEEALERLPEADGALRARLLARLAAALYWSAEPERRLAVAQDAIAMARRVGDPATLALVLSDSHRATWDPDSPERALPWASEIYALAERVGNMELALTAHEWRISLLLELGELAIVDREMQTFAHTARQLHQQRALVAVRVQECARALIAGRFDEAEGLLGRTAEFAGLLGQDQFLGMRLSALAFVMRYAQGRLGELEPAVRQLADAQPAMPVWRCGLACVYLQTGREAELRREYERLSADAFGGLPRDNLWLPALALLAEACAHLDDRKGARTLEALLAPYSGRNVVSPDIAYVGPVDRYLALLATTVGDHERAAEHFAAALELARGMGAGPMCAQLALDQAQALRERDPVRSAALAGEAAAEGKSLGLERLVATAQALVGFEDGDGEAPTVTAHAGRVRRRGDVWEMSWAGAPFHIRDAKGLQYLVRLLARPGQELHALDLAGGIGAPAPGGAVADAELSIRGGFGQDDAGPLLDARAKAEYRRRIDDLREEIEEAENFNDFERAGSARTELDFLAGELSAAVGLGGRDRRAAAASERARVNVTRALRATVERIGKHDPVLGHHLSTCVRTGTFCRYEPGPDAPRWDIAPLP